MCSNCIIKVPSYEYGDQNHYGCIFTREFRFTWGAMVIGLPEHALLVNEATCHISKGKSSKMFCRAQPGTLRPQIYMQYARVFFCSQMRKPLRKYTFSTLLQLFSSFTRIYYLITIFVKQLWTAPMAQFYLTAIPYDWWTSFAREHGIIRA